jgi:hypothetical protein
MTRDEIRRTLTWRERARRRHHRDRFARERLRNRAHRAKPLPAKKLAK